MQTQPTISSQFGELIEPEPVAFSFDAPGWYVVFGLILLGFIVYGVVQLIRYRRNKYRRDALAYLTEVEGRANTNHGQLLYEAHVLLKRIALRFNRKATAHLVGTEWLDFLNNSCKKAAFEKSDGEWLQRVIYQQDVQLEASDLEGHLKGIRYWIKNHELR